MKRCEHKESVWTRDGKECSKCFLTWSIALKERRKFKKEQSKTKKLQIVNRYCSCGSLLVGHGDVQCLKCILKHTDF